LHLLVDSTGIKMLGERVMARDFDRQVAELQVRTAVLNRFTRLDTPITVSVL
jgi:chromosome condensin MukBEF MukE localization factor